MSKQLVLASVLVGVASCSSKPAAKSEVPPAPVVAAAAAAAPAQAPQEGEGDFEVAGVANASRNARVSAKTGGIVASIKAREGTWASEGQVLVALDTTDIEIRAEQAAVALATAEAAVDSAASDLKRAQELWKGGAMTGQGIEKAELGLRMAKLQADGARVAVRMAKQALSDSYIKAPFAGVITKMFFEAGQMITTMPPTVLYQLVDTSALEVKVAIPERMLAFVPLGQAAVVTFPSMGIERSGKIDRMPEVVDPVTRSADAYIHLDNKDRKIPAGLYARVRFPGVKADQGLREERGAAVTQAPTAPAVEQAQ